MSGDSPASLKASTKHLWIAIALLAIAASITGITNGFAFDDVQVIVKDPRIHTLADSWRFFTESYWRAELGSSLYRPLTMLVFAMQWLAGGGSALLFHVTSILLYAALSVAVYRLALLLLAPRAAFFAAAIFAVHPVHVEAVANVVGQAELWVAFLLVLLVERYVCIRRSGMPTAFHIAAIAGGYLVACGFKEHAILLPGLLVAAELFVVGDERPLGNRVRVLMPLFGALGLVALGFLAARFAVLHSLSSNTTVPVLNHQPFSTRFFTMLTVVIEWVRLFFWPMSLSADYSYPRVRAHTSFEPLMLPAIAVIVGVAWLGWTLRKRSPAATFGISWTGVALLIPSNLIVVTGFVLAERTLLLPSVGFVVCAGLAVDMALRAAAASSFAVAQRAPAAMFAAILIAFTVRSATRSPVWRDNETLFSQTVMDVPSSHRAHWMRAVDLSEKNRIPEALDEMDLAVVLSDGSDPLLLAYGGDMFATAGKCPRAVTLYRRALELAPGNVQLRANTSWCLLRLGKAVEAKRIALEAGAKVADSRLQKLIHEADTLALAANVVAR